MYFNVAHNARVKRDGRTLIHENGYSVCSGLSHVDAFNEIVQTSITAQPDKHDKVYNAHNGSNLFRAKIVPIIISTVYTRIVIMNGVAVATAASHPHHEDLSLTNAPHTFMTTDIRLNVDFNETATPRLDWVD